MKNTSFYRKIVYLLLMAGLLVPLYQVSAPSFHDADGTLTPGGWLTQIRADKGLSQANLGEIDPASESMKLATLGMRGVAANLLWGRANEYKKKEEWDNLRATLNQIAKLQPNFISVWSFQAWNLSYNVSVEFDNYEHRYHWVKKGIEFLMQGIRYNTNEPRLLWDLGWFFGHKFGRSDEYRQFRRKYNSDEDFHESLAGNINVSEALDYKGEPDNWLTAYQWHSEAQRVVDLEDARIVGKNPLVFHSDSAKALIRYADAIEEEGMFEEVARIAWRNAYDRWMQYGNREIPTSYGYMIRLNEGERWNEIVTQREKELEDLIPGLQKKLRDEKIAKLPPEEQALVDIDRRALPSEQYEVAISAQEKVKVTAEELAAASQDGREVKRLSNAIVTAKAYSTTIRRYRDIVNYLYWRTRCEVEQEDRALEGRQYLWEADELYEEADLVGAKQKYDEAWKRWATIHRDHQVLADDVTAEDLVDAIKKYRKVLSQLDEEFPPAGFPMLRLVANYADDFELTQAEANAMLAEADRMDATGEGQSEQDEPGAADADETDSSTSEADSTAEQDPPADDDNEPTEDDADNTNDEATTPAEENDPPSDDESAPADDSTTSDAATEPAPSDDADESDDASESGDEDSESADEDADEANDEPTDEEDVDEADE